MNKVLSAFPLLILFSLQTYAQITNSPTYVINGNITGIDSGKIYSLSSDRKVIDSADIVKGQFSISGKLYLPEQKVFRLNPGQWEFAAFVDAPRITFDIDTAGAEHYYFAGKDYPLIRQIKETGSPFADVYDSYQKGTGLAELLYFTRKLRLAKNDSVAYFNEKVDSLRKALPPKFKIWVEDYVRQHPTSIPAVYIFKEYFHELGKNSSVYLRSIISQFSGPAKSSVYYESLMSELLRLENIRVGKPAPDFTLLKRDNNKFKLSTTLGSVVMLDFWASWCKPCRAGIPGWKKVYAKYHQKGFNIISITDDKSWKSWKIALDQEKMPWTQVIDDAPPGTLSGRVGQQYNVHSLPYFVLIDKKGNIIIASGDEHAVKKEIAEVLK
ncbi:AhpC/TSA family protein [Mucilaginibacter sp. Bleaf8]|uniref:TlpA disulfide reductase family protein n=1 Tax=Mucilaginibacter sp. Bleaf8 TaxID=2834430 RepID=UPI001BD14BBF|nr:TlpA disulfide reductase family protein [Mucilaginibacter sp. Bleaf8]MBS7564717.1 AhpC/TSA family protein [Mucilaginibacter sp. Bleaf8]